MSKYEYVGTSLLEIDARLKKEKLDFEIARGIGMGGVFLGIVPELDILGNIATNVAMVKMLKQMFTITSLQKDDFAYRNSREYIELECSYNRVIKDLASLFLELGIEDSIAIATIYRDMLEKGHFSLYDRFEPTNSSISMSGLYGTNVISGMGSSAHINCMLADLLRENGVKANAALMLMDCDLKTLSNSIYNDLPDWMHSPEFKNIIFNVIKVATKVALPFIQDRQGETLGGNKIGTAVIDPDFSFVVTGGYAGISCVESDFTVQLAGHRYSLYDHQHLNPTGRFLKPKDMVGIPQIENVTEEINGRMEKARRQSSDFEEAFIEFYKQHQELYALVAARRKQLIDVCDESRYFRTRVHRSRH